ncbi:MAG: proton-conducting transporter membrane subunit [Methanophagales archaeon]|nr:proton-conducting transporter membrane subunit [Methanophagales archaeon]
MPIFDILCWIAAFGKIIGSILAIAQYNLKRMLAYSSVSQMGYIMLAVGLSVSATTHPWCGLTPALMHILNHALMKGWQGLLFTRRSCGVYRISRVWEGIGVPPSVGFVSKVYIILASLDAGKFVFVAIMLLSTLLNLVYFWRVIETMYMKREEGEEHSSSSVKDEIPLSMLIPILTLASLSLSASSWASSGSLRYLCPYLTKLTHCLD